MPKSGVLVVCESGATWTTTLEGTKKRVWPWISPILNHQEQETLLEQVLQNGDNQTQGHDER